MPVLGKGIEKEEKTENSYYFQSKKKPVEGWRDGHSRKCFKKQRKQNSQEKKSLQLPEDK